METVGAVTLGGGGGGELGRRMLEAARVGESRVLLELMAAGAPFTSDWLGTTALHLAAANDHLEACQVLLRAGITRDSPTRTFRTPLHLAATRGHTAIVLLLLENGAESSPRDLLEMTPLHWAAQGGHKDCVRALLQHGAGVAPISKFLKTPLMLAEENGHEKVVRILNEYQPTVNNQEIDSQPTFIKEHSPEKTQIEQETEEVGVTEVADTESDGVERLRRLLGGIGGAGILQKHGITLLEPDTENTVLSAIQNGRTIVLSDAGKQILEESGVTVRSPSVGVKGAAMRVSSVRAGAQTAAGAGGGAGVSRTGNGAQGLVVPAALVRSRDVEEVRSLALTAYQRLQRAQHEVRRLKSLLRAHGIPLT